MSCRTHTHYGTQFDSCLPWASEIHRKEGGYLVHEGLVHIVRAADGKIHNVDLVLDGVVEGVQEPRCVGNL